MSRIPRRSPTSQCGLGVKENVRGSPHERPTTSCDSSGPTGADGSDMFGRYRSFSVRSSSITFSSFSIAATRSPTARSRVRVVSSGLPAREARFRSARNASLSTRSSRARRSSSRISSSGATAFRLRRFSRTSSACSRTNGSGSMARYGIDAMRISPSTTRVAIVSFEGPDRFSTVGGLATRVTDLVPALTSRGYDVTHVFIGDPALEPDERRDGARLVRWGQWISRQHPRDVYDGEWGKWRDLSENVPQWLFENVVAPEGQSILLFEDWQTAEAASRTAELAYVRGASRRSVALWNANNTYGCGAVDFERLEMTVRVTTVSRWMRSELRQFGVADAIVIPNGISERMLAPVTASDATALRGALDAYLVFVKVARFDRDKRWLAAIDAIAELKRRGTDVRFLFRGSASPYRDEVLTHLRRRELSVTNLRLDGT